MSLLKMIVKRLRQVAFSFKEKSSPKVDDYVLEHFLLYHGLAGSSPDNQRSFRDVQEDIRSAVQNLSSLQLGISLKLQPLWWEDRLQTIISGLEKRDSLANCLLPTLEDTSWPNQSDPLGHPDWRTRANAAKILAFIGEASATPKLIQSMDDTASNAKPAFCHIAYALASFNDADGLTALTRFIEAEEPWFRVDAAGALASSTATDVLPDLSRALFSHHELIDYTAVVISRHRSLESFLYHPDESVRDGGFALVLNLVAASAQTFDKDVVMAADVVSHLEHLFALAQASPSPLRLRTLFKLTTWMKSTNLKAARLSEVEGFVTSTSSRELITNVIQAVDSTSTASSANGLQLRSAIALAGELEIAEASPLLLPVIKSSGPFKEEVIEALGAIGDKSAAADIIFQINKSVDVQDRANRTVSAHPVPEENPEGAKLYFLSLKALSRMPTSDTVSLLSRATEDYAPDIREQAIKSLISCSLLDKNITSTSFIHDVLTKGFSDPNTAVRSASIKAAGQVLDFELLSPIIDGLNAREISTSRQAQEALSYLWKANSTKVNAALEERLSKETDSYKKKKITDFLKAHRAR